MATRTVEVIITGNSASAQLAFAKLDAAAAASGISLQKHSVAAASAAGKTKELETVGVATAASLQTQLRRGVDDVAVAMGSRLGPAGRVAGDATRALGNEALTATGAMKVAAGAAIVGGVAVLALGAYALSSVSSWAALGEKVLAFQRVSGTTAEEASRLIFVMGQLGISSDTLTSAMFRMTRVDPGKLHELGVEIMYNADGSKNLAGTLDNVRAAYLATEDPAQRNLLLFAAFGKAGQALAPYLAASAEQMRILNAEADKYHAIYTQDQLDKAHQYELATHAMSAAMAGFGSELANVVIPALTATVKGVTSLAESVDHAGQEATKSKGAHAALSTAVSVLGTVFSFGSKLGESFGKSLVNTTLGPLKAIGAGANEAGKGISDAAFAVSLATGVHIDFASKLSTTGHFLAGLVPGLDDATKSTKKHSDASKEAAKAEDEVAKANMQASQGYFTLSSAQIANMEVLLAQRTVIDKNSDSTLALKENLKEVAKGEAEFAKTVSSFIDPMKAYDDIMSKNSKQATEDAKAQTAAEKEGAQDRIDATRKEYANKISAARAYGKQHKESSAAVVKTLQDERDAAVNDLEDEKKGYKNAADSVSVSVSEWVATLEKQVKDQDAWSKNLVILAGRAKTGTLQYLAELGPKGGALVAELVNASDAEMDRLNAVMDAKSQTATQAVVDRIKQAKPVWEEVMRQGGQGAVSALTAQLNAGTVTIADIAAAYGVNLAGGVNPILKGLGKEEIRVPGSRVYAMATGGWVDGPGGPRDDRVPILASNGEFVVNAKSAENNRAALEWMNAAKFADGGYVGFEDSSKVPRPPSTNPFRTPISPPADETMQREYDEAVKWVNENAGGGLPEIKAWINAQSGKPYIWGGGGPGGYDCCIVGSVRVYGNYGAKPIQDIRPGDEVYSYVDGKLTTNKVTAAWQSKTQPVFKVRTRNRSVTASANHPFMRLVRVERGYQVKGGWQGERVNDRYDVEWVRLDQLRSRDLVVQPRAMPVEAPLDPTLSGGVPVTPDLAWLIGAAIGDGTVTAKGLRLALFGEKRERAVGIMVSTWGGRPLRHATAGIVHSNVALRNALEALGMRCLGPVKRVPMAVWTWPAELRQAFLDGYCDADGHRPADPKRHGDRTYHSCSRELIEDVRALHIMLGQPVSNVTETKRTRPITIKGKIVKNALTQHAFTVWPGKGKTGEVNDRHNHPGIATWLDRNSGFTINPVLTITDEGIQDTYDLTVEGAHNFIADGVVVHNSGYTGAVYGLMTGQGGGQGQRYFTTLSDFHALGFSDGPGGTYTIGVSPSHMVGRYGGLPFEAGHTPIVAGPGAQNTAHFPRQYHMGGNGPGQGVGAGSGGMWLGDSGTPAGGAKGYAQSVLNARGWGDQFGALDFIFTNESGWDAGPGSVNPSSGAYGIPQANPSGGQGHPYELGDWKAQVDWGINYIAERYGDPNGAAAFWRGHSWYDQGGILPPGTTLTTNATGQNEYVLNQGQMANLVRTARIGSAGTGTTTIKQFNLGGVQVRDTAAAVLAEFHRLELLAGV